MENRYDKYKDSGIAWIGEIPEHWKVKKLGHLYIPRNEKVSDQDYPALSVTMQGVLLQLENVAKTNDGDNRKLVKIGDFAINSRSDRRGSCGISKYDGSVSLINTVLIPINDMNPVFYEWLFHSSLFSDEYYRWGHGIVNDLWTTKWQEMKNIQIVAPPLQEQQSIAAYLDQKCGEIDELITLQEEMITKLQSYKQSVITEAVTKGLDKNVPLKDSGIKWIGKIPEHWKITKVQYLAQLKSGYNLTTEEITDNGLYPVYGGNGIRGYYDKYFLERDYVLIGRQGALCGNINYSTNKSWATEHAVVCYPKIKYVTRWFGELLRVMNLNQYSLAAAQPGLAVERIKLLPIPIIPLSEQQAIADYLDQKCSEIDELISIKQQKIEKLKEYKKSLIFECVTGKRKVS